MDFEDKQLLQRYKKLGFTPEQLENFIHTVYLQMSWYDRCEYLIQPNDDKKTFCIKRRYLDEEESKYEIVYHRVVFDGDGTLPITVLDDISFELRMCHLSE